MAVADLDMVAHRSAREKSSGLQAEKHRFFLRAVFSDLSQRQDDAAQEFEIGPLARYLQRLAHIGGKSWRSTVLGAHFQNWAFRLCGNLEVGNY